MTSVDRPRFDLTREPWISCEGLDGERVSLGFEDVLVRAHELSAVHDESPLTTAVLHRLLLAALHRIVDGPNDLDAWISLWQAPRFDEERVRAYFVKWRHRFDLFDAERPFLQVPRLAEVLAEERGGKETGTLYARRLPMETSYAGGTALLDHGADDVALTPSEALRGLLGFLGFAPGGRIMNRADSAGGCPLRVGAVVLARGRTLRETLLLNLFVPELVPKNVLPPSMPDDAPAWEHSEHAKDAVRPVRGWLDALTWQARCVELLPEIIDGSVRVRTVITGAGDAPEEWVEPMFAVKAGDTQREPYPLTISPEKSPWRDADVLFQAGAGDSLHRRPAVVSQIAQLVEEGILDRSALFQLDLFGLASNKAAIDLSRAEHVPLPLRLLVDAERLACVHTALDHANEIHVALRKSIWLLARYAIASGPLAPDKKNIGSLVDRLAAKPQYWARLGAKFDDFLGHLVAAEDPDPVIVMWKETARAIARDVLRESAEQLGTTARALQARAHAERHLAIELAALFPPQTAVPPQQGAPR